MPKQTRRSHNKSRTGCLSCKRLRIKCDEAKPRCEYCESTNKVCEYPIIQHAYEAPPSNTSRRQNTVASENKPKTIEITIEQVNLASMSTDISIPPPMKSPISHVFRNIAYNDIFNFFITTSCNALGMNSPLILDTWKQVVPRVALTSPMVLYGIISYSALSKYKMVRYMMQKKQAALGGNVLMVPESTLIDQENLRNLAFNGFNTLVRLLSKALSSSAPQKRFEEIHISSLLVASFAMAEPSVARLVSADPYSPDLFGLMRGCFNVPSTVLEVGDGLAEKSEIKNIITKPNEVFPSREDVENIDIGEEYFSFYRMLLRQLEQLENGEKGVFILSGFPSSDGSVVNMNAPDVKEKDQEWTDTQTSAATISPSSSSPSTGSSPDAQSPLSPVTIPDSKIPTMIPDMRTTGPDTDSFTLLPHEPAIYRTVIYTFIHLAHLGMLNKRPTYMIHSFNLLPDEFIIQLRLNRPFAIVISAFMISQIEFISRHPIFMDALELRLDTLEDMLPYEWRPALYWPKSIIKNRVYEPGLGKMVSMMGIPMTGA